MAEPVSLAKFKAHLRIFHTQQDDLLTDILVQAREDIEAETWLCLVPTTKTIIRRAFPGASSPGAANYPNNQYPGNAFQSGTYPNTASVGMRGRADAPLYLPGPPARSITSVNYIDDTGATVALTDYRSQLTKKPAWLEPAFGDVWPVTRDDPNAVTIVYEAGYDDEGAVDVLNGKCPGPLKRAILLLGAEAYENSAPVPIKGMTTVERLIHKYRVRHYGLLESL
ncbi:MAG: phage head-tail connector protein [Planctomycetes bacterium]|nr:phage head-tail connector protein [Planctomycetota bacterium]